MSDRVKATPEQSKLATGMKSKYKSVFPEGGELKLWVDSEGRFHGKAGSGADETRFWQASKGGAWSSQMGDENDPFMFKEASSFNAMVDMWNDPASMP